MGSTGDQRESEGIERERRRGAALRDAPLMTLHLPITHPFFLAHTHFFRPFSTPFRQFSRSLRHATLFSHCVVLRPFFHLDS